MVKLNIFHLISTLTFLPVGKEKSVPLKCGSYLALTKVSLAIFDNMSAVSMKNMFCWSKKVDITYKK